MALGKVVIATDANGSRDYVTDGETAVVVPAGDVAALSRSLRLLLGDEALRNQLGAAAQAWAIARLQPGAFARAVLDLT